MPILIESIDFKERSLILEITDYSKESDAELRAFLTHCSKLRYRVLQIWHAETLRKTELTRLKSYAKAAGIATGLREDNNELIPSDGLSTILMLRRASSNVASSGQPSFVEYTLRGLVSESMLTNARDFVLLVAHSIPLDKRLISRLRLGVYELAVNSIEHGSFLHAVPQIEICIGVSTDIVEVIYKDNATVFRTSSPNDVSIEAQITSRRKRGLGLSMIRKLSKNLRFERIGNWNCTAFTLDRYGMDPQRKRRSEMDEFTVEIIPQKLKETLVLRPRGSIDSVSAPVFEKHFKDAMEAGHRWIIIDLSETDFVSSAGLGLILGTVATLREKGGDMILMKVPQDLTDIFELMSIEDYFVTIESLDDLEARKQ